MPTQSPKDTISNTPQQTVTLTFEQGTEKQLLASLLTETSLVRASLARLEQLVSELNTAAETVLGVQYPNMAEKRVADSSMEPPVKISKGESTHLHHNGGTGATNFITTRESSKAVKHTFKKVFQIQGESVRWRRGQNSTAYCKSQGLNAATFQNNN